MESKREQAMVGSFVLIAGAVLVGTIFTLTGAFGGSATTSTAPAIKTKIPTMACSRFDSIAHLFPRRSTARAVIFRQHLQIVQFLRNFRLGNTVQELPHPRLRARAHFFRGTDGHHVSLIDQHHAVG